MNKPVITVGVPTISRLFRGEDVEIESAVLIPDDQLHNLAHASAKVEPRSDNNHFMQGLKPNSSATS